MIVVVTSSHIYQLITTRPDCLVAIVYGTGPLGLGIGLGLKIRIGLWFRLELGLRIG